MSELVDPHTGADLELEVIASAEDGRGEIHEAVLRSGDRWYPVLGGVPRLLHDGLRDGPEFAKFARDHGLDQGAEAAEGTGQEITNITFSDKWRRFRNYGFESSHQTFLQSWYVEKLGVRDEDELRQFYRDKHRILEIGPGSGFNTAFMAEQSPGSVFSVDISEAAVTTYGNVGNKPNCHVIQADLMQLPLRDASFDFIIADGVLHHTPDTHAAVQALYRKLAPGGQFFFYVYKQMGAARVFCDQHIREQFTKLEPEACYEACEGITELGRELSKLDARVRLEKGIPVLGVPPGDHNVQRLLYYSFLKCFWNDAFDWETNNMVNFDWYHPHHAWQHTVDEVRGWLQGLGVGEFSFNDANPNGISVLLRKPME